MGDAMRVVSWFSCGAASTVATKLAIAEYGDQVVVANCEVIEEHPDNSRYLKDAQEWFGQEIILLGNDKYARSIYEVFEQTRYISGNKGARCTVELKKKVRIKYQRPDDIHVMGYTCEEEGRYQRFCDSNNEIHAIAPLIDRGITKQDCLAMVQDAGIALPAMYLLGYNNNNCRGCCQSSSPAYWKKIQIDFPDYFEKMSRQEQRLDVKICKATIDGVADVRMKLTDLPEWIEPKDDSIDVQCGIFCEMAKGEYEDD